MPRRRPTGARPATALALVLAALVLPARADDIANYLPARLTYLLLSFAAWITGCNGKAALRIGWRDGCKHPSPNAGWPEAAMAGALGVQLGGP